MIWSSLFVRLRYGYHGWFTSSSWGRFPGGSPRMTDPGCCLTWIAQVVRAIFCPWGIRPGDVEDEDDDDDDDDDYDYDDDDYDYDCYYYHDDIHVCYISLSGDGLCSCFVLAGYMVSRGLLPKLRTAAPACLVGEAQWPKLFAAEQDKRPYFRGYPMENHHISLKKHNF